MDAHYRIAIFGSARIKEGDQVYEEVYSISRGLAEAGFDIVTGGGPGLMQAANSGHRSVANGTHSIGLNIKLPFEQEGNKFLDINREFDRFSERLDTFMSLSDAVVVATGGIGTLLELFYSWQLTQVEHICETPIILYGEMWTGLLEWLKGEVMSRGLFDQKEIRNVFHLNSVVEVVRFIKQVHADRAEMEHVCVNYDKYRVEFS